MFLRGGLEYNAGRALAVISLASLAPFIFVLAPRAGALLPGWTGKLPDLALTAALIGSLTGWGSMFLLARAYAEWGMKPPVATIGLGAAIGLTGLVGTHFARPEAIPRPWPWVLGAIAVAITGLLFRRLARIKPEA